MILEVASGLGGAKRMLEWAQEAPENERAFWVQVYPKLLPLQIAGDPESPLETITRIEIVPLGDGAG